MLLMILFEKTKKAISNGTVATTDPESATSDLLKMNAVNDRILSGTVLTVSLCRNTSGMKNWFQMTTDMMMQVLKMTEDARGTMMLRNILHSDAPSILADS